MAAISILSVVVLSAALTPTSHAAPHPSPGNREPAMPAASSLIDPTQPGSLGHGYSRSGDHIYFNGVRIDQAGRDTFADFQKHMDRRLVLAHDVHAPSFVALSEDYSKDQNTVYYKWISPGRFWVVEIPDADPATFEVMDFNLAKDAKRVWRTDVPIKGADAPTACVVNPGWVWRDKNSVYYQFTRLAGADPETFRHLDQAFYADAKSVYWSATKLAGADVKTFRTFGSDTPYAADHQHVWFGETRMPNIDAASFRLFHNHVFADKNGVYVSGRALPIIDADPKTFEKVAELKSANSVLFRDANRRYLFEPGYIEVYTLTQTEDRIEISKPVWFGESTGPVRHAANVAATWKSGVLTQPQIVMQPRFERSAKPTWEADKLQRMTDAIAEAQALLEKKPEAPAAEADQPLEQRGTE